MRTIIIATLLASSLSGCIVTSGNALVDAVGLVGSTASSVRAMTPNSVQNPIVYSKDPIHEVCIEWNGSVALSDFVPGLQGELQKHGVQSRVYDAGTQSLACPVTLSYVGYVKWDTKVFTDAYTPYLTYAALTLRREGRVLGTAQYRLGSFGQDKWASAGDKLAPLVDALFPGNPQVADNSPGNMRSAANGF
ncbi:MULTISPECIES: cell division protein FtsI [Herbaspirillum]|uniref:Cell division protein FtsI n=1 Tax=Herbaspirillum aquaticum TaxID=568783 RepID=A0A225SQ12_9BURK|nr:MULTISPECIES: cell division protein FtsI [Herbaspirillum]MBW9335837.1 cell division protein FtsI [Herbaspirillum sp. RU 5E]MRT31544.1 cell division protein FtsI [Herbaspirillum sp. CAH-3]OWY32604.1 cell division protein FtsI [Herbaspirillum aquaticum]